MTRESFPTKETLSNNNLYRKGAALIGTVALLLSGCGVGAQESNSQPSSEVAVSQSVDAQSGDNNTAGGESSNNETVNSESSNNTSSPEDSSELKVYHDSLAPGYYTEGRFIVIQDSQEDLSKGPRITNKRDFELLELCGINSTYYAWSLQGGEGSRGVWITEPNSPECEGDGPLSKLDSSLQKNGHVQSSNDYRFGICVDVTEGDGLPMDATYQEVRSIDITTGNAPSIGEKPEDNPPHALLAGRTCEERY